MEENGRIPTRRTYKWRFSLPTDFCFLLTEFSEDIQITKSLYLQFIWIWHDKVRCATCIFDPRDSSIHSYEILLLKVIFNCSIYTFGNSILNYLNTHIVYYGYYIRIVLSSSYKHTTFSFCSTNFMKLTLPLEWVDFVIKL